jgi:hypothetical protein
MAKTFTKFGLKRDSNLSDVPNKERALNNLLRDLRGSKPSFTLEDLDCLQELFPKGVTNEDFRKLAGIAVKFLNADPDSSVPLGTSLSFEPLVTLENRFDRAYFTVADPFFFGGDGLTAKYYDNDQIVRASAGVPTSNFTGFSGDPVVINNNWEDGRFAYTNKITSEFLSLYGAVQWTGFFKPTVSGVHIFRISTTGFYKFEFDDGSGNFDFTFDQPTQTFNYNNTNFNTGLITLNDETKVDSSFNIIRVDSQGASSTLDSTIGETRERNITIPYPLEEFKAYKIRLTFFIDEISIPNPEVNLFSTEKRFFIRITDPDDRSSRRLNFKNLYDEIYFTNYVLGDFKDYVDKSIYFGGTKIGNRLTIGSTSAQQNSSNYANVSSLSKVITYYDPPKNTSNILNTKTLTTYTNQNGIVTFNNTDANKTEGIEVGNYVIGTGIPENTRVQEIIINTAVILDKTPTQSQSNVNLTFVNHRGFVGTGIGNTTSGTNSISSITGLTNVNDVSQGLVVISPAYTGNDYVRLISYNGSTMTLTRNMNTTTTGGRFYVYYDVGLVNDSLKTFCQGVLAKRVVQPVGQLPQNDFTYNPGTTVLTLSNVDGLTTGMYIHLYPATPNTIVNVNGVDEIRSTATITSIDTVNRTITVSSGLVSSITYTPATITNMTFTPSNVDVNKEVCFIPSDTSPPFSATSEGLGTSQNVKLVTNYGGAVNTNAECIYERLFINCTPSEVKPTMSQDTVTHLMPIRDRNNTLYYLLMDS